MTKYRVDVYLLGENDPLAVVFVKAANVKEAHTKVRAALQLSVEQTETWPDNPKVIV